MRREFKVWSSDRTASVTLKIDMNGYASSHLDVIMKMANDKLAAQVDDAVGETDFGWDADELHKIASEIELTMRENYDAPRGATISIMQV